MQNLDTGAGLCWPDVGQVYPQGGMDRMSTSRCLPGQEMSWPVSESWRRNTGQPQCTGMCGCQRDPQVCNAGYRQGVDDVGPCPTEQSCKMSYSCAPCPQPCPNPCPAVPGCNRLTTRCFDWPISSTQKCPSENTNLDLRPPRADLNILTNQPERCPTCKRVVVDMVCGPLGYNY